MRLPVHNVCRAFPELDRFTDAQCERFLSATLQQHWIARQAMRVVIAACFCIGWFGLTYVVMLIVVSFGPRNSTLQVPLAFASVIVGALMGGIAGLMLRDRWLRARLSARLLQLACPGCGYSLLGLPAVEGVITCPECGNPCDLAARQIAIDTTLVPQ